MNFESFIGAQGAGFVQRKLAASMNLVHTISMDSPLLSRFMLKEKGGPLDLTTTYTIGARDWQDTEIVKRKFKEKSYWEVTPVEFTYVNQ